MHLTDYLIICISCSQQQRSTWFRLFNIYQQLLPDEPLKCSLSKIQNESTICFNTLNRLTKREKSLEIPTNTTVHNKLSYTFRQARDLSINGGKISLICVTTSKRREKGHSNQERLEL